MEKDASRTCKLCLKKKADKKGSHIVPHFILKRIENIENNKGRDYELGFVIGEVNSSSHFGRAIQPEKLEEVYGEITDEDLINNKHPLIVDNFFCTECEKRFSEIENKYSKAIEIIGDSEYETGLLGEIGILFWASVLWRMSINGKSGVKLTSQENELLRNTIDSYLPTVQGEINFELLGQDGTVNLMSYKLLRCNKILQDDAKWLLFHPGFSKPFCLFIDEYILAFAIDNSFIEIDEIDFYGINKIIYNAPINRIGIKEKIYGFRNEIYKSITNKMLLNVKENYLKNLFELFDELHIKLGGRGQHMPDVIKYEILDELTSETKKTGRRYTQEELINSTIKVMRKYLRFTD